LTKGARPFNLVRLALIPRPAQRQQVSLARRTVRRLRFLFGLRVLPPRVAWFYLRAHRAAFKAGDQWSIDSAAPPNDLAVLIELARGRKKVTELGTGTAWTAIALALADGERTVMTCDPIFRAERDLYLSLVGAGVRERIELLTVPGNVAARTAPSMDMLFIDSSHERSETVSEFKAWYPVLGDAGIVAFHDFRHPLYPGVAEAVRELGLEGEVRGGIFVWRAEREDQKSSPIGAG
jgi:predicted O-methyltransferase YrrM